MEYLVNNKRFSLSYQELKENYIKFGSMCKEDFITNAAKVLHLTCVISYLKEIPSSVLLCDDCLIHELSHLIDGTETVLTVEEIRNLFIEQMKLN